MIIMFLMIVLRAAKCIFKSRNLKKSILKQWEKIVDKVSIMEMN